MIKKFETIDHEIIEYQYHKKGDDTLIFLPALGFDYTYWTKSVTYFDTRKYSTLVITLRGHTKLKTALKHITMEDHIQDLHGLVNHLGIKKPVLIGASLGGTVAAAYFQRYKPEVKTCICINTPFSASDIYPYIRWAVEILHPLLFLDRFERKRTGDFSTSKHTHNFLLFLQYSLIFHPLGFYLNYLCVKRLGNLSREGIITIDSTHDEVLKKRQYYNFLIDGNHNVVIGNADTVNKLVEKILAAY